jgi:putative NIF3 family GTP cyclohydrolase 1 type 2
VGEADGIGAGRFGNLPGENLSRLLATIKHQFQLGSIRYVGQPDAEVSRAAVACGSGGSFLSAAIAAGCDTFVTGEATFHTCLEAKANQVSLVLMGHYGSERFAIEMLGEQIADQFPDLQVWSSATESDPISVAP